MKTTVEARPRMTLEEFADTHGLEMVVRERSAVVGFPEGHPARWYAAFRGVEVRQREIMLASLYGNGRTPEEAIANYGPEISEQTIVVDAMQPTRREIRVPIIVPAAPTESESSHPETKESEQ